MMLVSGLSLVRRLFYLYTFFFVFGGLESMSHRVSLDTQLYHAYWKIAQNDNVEGMHLSLSSTQANGQFRSHD